jgi:serine/threonine protein kinase
MPDYYRAPEVILKAKWDNKVDIWSVAMVVSRARLGFQLLKTYVNPRCKAWGIVCPRTIIKGDIREGIIDDGAHIAELVALLGHPPPEFLAKERMGWAFWDEAGKWKDRVSIPEGRTLEKLAADIQGEDVGGFLRWLRLALRWNPEDRPTAMGLMKDPWLAKGTG